MYKRLAEAYVNNNIEEYIQKNTRIVTKKYKYNIDINIPSENKWTSQKINKFY